MPWRRVDHLPFLHPALIGIGVAAGLAWSAAAPERLRRPLWGLVAGAGAALVAGLAGLVPWLGRLQLTLYGVCMLAAFALGWWIMRRRGLRIGIDPYLVRVQLALAVVCGVVGARLWYVIEYRHLFPSPTAAPTAWLTLAADLDRGGAVWYGGLLLAGAAMLLHARRERMPLIPWADCVAPAVLAGLAVGRVGCFLNGCCWGAPCSLPWAVPHGGVHVHPTQLYETLVCGVLALLVARCAPGRGAAAGWALVGYAAWRFANETMRGDYAVKLGQGFSLSPFHLTSAQWLALPLAGLGAWLLWRARRTAP